MQRGWIPIVFVAGLLTSCASSPTAPKQVLPAGIDFDISGGFTIADFALRIEVDGGAVLREFRHYDGTIKTLRGRLSNAEIGTLTGLLPAFDGFAPSYCDGLGPADTPNVTFAVSTAAGTRRVLICANDSGNDLPQALRDLRATLNAISWRLAESPPQSPFGAPIARGF